MKNFIIAVDFDGTCVEHDFPRIGKDAPHAVEVLRRLSDSGVKLMLWTMRSGPTLEDAMTWFEPRGIPLWGINKNPEQHWSTSNKQYANLYIDDMALGCPLTLDSKGRNIVDWVAVFKLLDKHSFHIEPILPHEQTKTRAHQAGN